MDEEKTNEDCQYYRSISRKSMITKRKRIKSTNTKTKRI